MFRLAGVSSHILDTVRAETMRRMFSFSLWNVRIFCFSLECVMQLMMTTKAISFSSIWWFSLNEIAAESKGESDYKNNFQTWTDGLAWASQELCALN